MMSPIPETVCQLDELITKPPQAVLEAIASCEGGFMVLGAGGKMGFHVCRMLQRSLAELGRRDRLTAVSRFSSDASSDPFRQSGIETIAADLSDEPQVQRLPHADNVIFLAGTKFGTHDRPESLERMNVRMPRLIARHYGDARIVALSTGCVYSFVSVTSRGASEQSEQDPPGDYARSCIGREKAFIDASATDGTRCSLVRLNYSIDLRYGVLVDIAKNLLCGHPVSVDTGYVNLIWQGDAVAHILQCLPRAASPPFIVNVTGADSLSVRVLACELAERLGIEPSFSGEEADTAWLSDSSMSHRLFGVPSIGVDQMLDWTAEWLQRGCETLNKPTQFQTRDGNF